MVILKILAVVVFIVWLLGTVLFIWGLSEDYMRAKSSLDPNLRPKKWHWILIPIMAAFWWLFVLWAWPKKSS